MAPMFYVKSVEYGHEKRFILCRLWENGGLHWAYINGLVVGSEYHAFNHYWDELPQTEAEAWNHLPIEYKGLSNGTF